MSIRFVNAGDEPDRFLQAEVFDQARMDFVRHAAKLRFLVSVRRVLHTVADPRLDVTGDVGEQQVRRRTGRPRRAARRQYVRPRPRAAGSTGAASCVRRRCVMSRPVDTKCVIAPVRRAPA
jgi:hypothetical protein